MIPWDTSLAHLKTYDVVFYFGLNAMDDKQYETLREYVRQGGKLVISLGQLRVEGKDSREVLSAAVDDDFLGVKLDKLPGLVKGKTQIEFFGRNGTVDGYYEMKPTGAMVVARIKEVTKNSFGKGNVYLYATDYISKVSEDCNTWLLSALAKPATLVGMGPSSDWIEHTVWEKGSTYVIPVFNHGRIRFPSGNGKDHGIWNGRIRLDFAKFPKLRGSKLEAYTVTFQDPKIKLTPVRIASDKNGASVELAVDKRVELVVGPKGLAKKEFFYGE
jgi:hypothetical protein